MHRSLPLSALLLGLSTTVPALHAQNYRFNTEHRRPVETTLNDLRQAEDRDRGHNRDHYENAMRSVSEFGNRLHEGGNFDKDKLDQAIGDVQSAADHAGSHSGARDILRRDADDLRALRQHYDDREYHYRH